MINMFQSVLIPEERKAVLIGKKGETKKMIERSTNSRIEINDSVDIYGEGLEVLKAANIVKAIG
ncbi:MAG: RNA-processing protein, partial [Spirochaetes bacterium]